jgi:cytoskeletal protein CcmA (bactofilin family)
MFSKTAAAGPNQAIATFLAAGSSVHGQITSEGDVDVAGNFVGTIIAGRLTIFPGGSVKGDVTARSLLIEGGYDGRAEAEAVRLGAQSKVQGQLTYRELAVEPGAKLDAQCRSQHRSRERALTVVTGVVAAAE